MSKFTPKQYATALFQSLQEASESNSAKATLDKQDMVIKSFAAILVKNYDRALFSKIAMQLKKLERTHAGAHEVVVTSARPIDRSVLKQIGEKVGKNSRIQEVIDPWVLGGMKVLINDELVIDGTLKTRIARMTEALIRN